MASPMPPDPYLALGLPRDAPANTIKTTYRKLILKFHPDKVQDAEQKQIAADQFHKVQTAYEIIGDEDKRARYDAQCKLAALKKDVMEKGGSNSPRSEVRSSKMRTDSPVRANYTARSERVHVEERRPYDADADYYERPRTTSRKDYEYERPTMKRAATAAPRTEKERIRASRQSAKENERSKQREKTRQTSRDTRKDRDFKYSSTPYAEPETASSSDSDTIVEPPRYARREEEDRRRDYYEQARRQKEDMARPFNVEERTRKMQSHESNARDYIQRSRGGSRQHSDAVRPPSPQRVSSSKDKVEFMKRGEGRQPVPVMVRRGSGRPRAAEPEEPPRRESPRRESPRRDRERTRRSSHDYGESTRKAPPLNHTKSAPGQIHLPETPRRAYSMQTEAEEKKEFVAPPFRRADTMPALNPRRERESTRKPTKSSGLRRTENIDSLPTPSPTPEPVNPKYQYGKEYADEFEEPTPDGYRTRTYSPAAKAKPTRSPSPMGKEERGRAASSRYPASAQRPPLPSSRTTSYVYSPGQGLQDMPTRPTLARGESLRRDHLYGEIPTTRSSPRQSRTKYSPPDEDVRYQQIRPEDVKYQTGYSSRRGSEVRPNYNRTNSYTSQAAY
ncbi:hypothetical protein Q7P37_003757 [Cladosporium fusiforme]